MSVINSDSVRAGASGVSEAYIIENSCRFNSADSASTIDASTTAGDMDRWNISVWIKLGTGFLGTSRRTVIEAHDASGYGTIIEFYNASGEIDSIRWSEDVSGGNTGNKYTTQKFRDPTAWSHYFFRWDSANSAAADRQQIFVNGVRLTDFNININVDQGQNSMLFDGTNDIRIGDSAGDRFFDGYMAEFIATEGVDHAATDFGETDSNGNWIPKDPSALTFGDEGWWLDFAVAPGTGNGAGTDVSGNGNHFADSNLAANDLTKDSPTDDAENDIGNYCTLSPLDKEPALVISDGNLTVLGSGYERGRGTQPCFDKCYFEAKMDSTSYAGTGGGARNQCGVATQQWNIYTTQLEASAYGWCTDQNLSPFVASVNGSAPGGSWDAGESICWALETNGADVDIWYRVNGGAWLIGGGDPAASSSPSMTAVGVAIGDLFPGVVCYSSSDKQTWNFGASGFDYTPPSGFKALHTGNHPAPAITDPSKYMQVDTFTGTGSELVRTLTDGGGSAYRPDFVWVKDRDTGVGHRLVDIARGATKEIASDTTAVEITSAQGVKSFDTSGYTLGTDTDYNASSSPNVAYTWVTQGGAGSSNTAGTINTTTTSVGTTQGFSISTYTGTGSAATIGHGLGAVPEFILVKNTTDVQSWRVYHHKNTAAPETDYLSLNTTAATVDSTEWNDTAPTSTVFSIGASLDAVNMNTKTHVAYCWAGVEGYSKFGTYLGNANADGPCIWCGFRPAFLIIKTTSGATGSWLAYTHKTPGFNPDNFHLNLEDTGAVEDTTDRVNFLSNGFKLIIGNGPNAAVTLCFAAFAEFPFGGDGVSQARAR